MLSASFSAMGLLSCEPSHSGLQSHPVTPPFFFKSVLKEWDPFSVPCKNSL